MHTVLLADAHGGKHPYNGAFWARELPQAWSGRVIITRASSVSCVTSHCDFVGAGISQLGQIGSGLVQDYLARYFSVRTAAYLAKQSNPSPQDRKGRQFELCSLRIPIGAG